VLTQLPNAQQERQGIAKAYKLATDRIGIWFARTASMSLLKDWATAWLLISLSAAFDQVQ
jgi:hypothetical protein